MEKVLSTSAGTKLGRQPMFTIGKEFHLLHVVNDLDAADGWYDDVFAVRRFVRNSMKAAMRKASLVLIADFVMEPAQPLRHMPGWEKSALGRFSSRYGQHFHSIAWYVAAVPGQQAGETSSILPAMREESGGVDFQCVGHTGAGAASCGSPQAQIGD